MADITTLNAATAVINALEYLRKGMALIHDTDHTLEANLDSGKSLAALTVAPSVPSAIVADMLAIMGIYQAAYDQVHAQFPGTMAWVPGTEIVAPAPAPDPTAPVNDPTS